MWVYIQCIYCMRGALLVLCCALRYRVIECRRYMTAIKDADEGCLRCYLRHVSSAAHNFDGGHLHRKLPRRVISTVLYGDNPRYTVGAVRNAQLLPVVFPGWRLRIYVPSSQSRLTSVPQLVIDRLLDLGTELIYVDPNDPESIAYRLAPMLWRFLVVDDPSVDVFLSRDIDSRLIERDAAAVFDWIGRLSPISTSDNLAGQQQRQPVRSFFPSTFHCIRDHPSHSNFPVNGGMWGAVRRELAALIGLDSTASGDADAEQPPTSGTRQSPNGDATIAKLMSRYGDAYMEDMNFMEREIWSRMTQEPSEVTASNQNTIRCHDSVSCDRWPGAERYPVGRRGAEHVGQVFDARSVPRQGDVDLLVAADRNGVCEPEPVIISTERSEFGARSSCTQNFVRTTA